MWIVILWILGTAVAAWVAYNAWDNMRFQNTVETAKKRLTASGRRVQSKGEERIANWLDERKIRYEYDKAVSYSLREPPIRPDFILPDHDLYVEYWGMMDDPEYAHHRQRKERIYKQQNWRLLSLTYEDLDKLEELFAPHLSASGGKGD